MPYALPSPSTSPTRSFSASRTETTRPLRHHMRSQSSDGLSHSTSFIYVHPASPDGARTPSPGGTGPSMHTVPRKPRRAKLFGFTPADDGPSSQEASPAEGNPVASTSKLAGSTTHLSPSMGPPLVPVALRPAHVKSASTPGRSLAEEIQNAFPNVRQTAMLRKKSGELVRSAIKTDFGRDQSHKPRSEPATPTCPKYVHFDTQLEHVKHFLSQQRPAAVSRSGSPIETETEDEPEAFPFPAMASPLSGGTLQIKLPNFPSRLDHNLDAYVESIEVGSDGKSLRGIVRVRNLSFEKWVAVRFTLDNWQTVSEVSGDHLESMGHNSDRFVFSIKLQDLLARIEEKTMFIAVRYTVGGREIWDNNNGANYRVEFAKTAPKPASPGSGLKRQTWSVTNAGQAADRMADLRRELDRLVQDDVDQSPLSTSTRSFSEGAAAFSTRYDFGNSLKMYGSNRGGGQNSPTKSTSPYASQNFVGGMPATLFPDPTSSPTASRLGLAPDFGSYMPVGGLPYPRYQTEQSGHYTPPSPPPEPQTSTLFLGTTKPSFQHHELASSPKSASSRTRFNSFPGGVTINSSPSTYVPLHPPTFRENRRRDSPFASPADSPIDSPILSPASTSPPRARSPPLYDNDSVSPEDVWSPTSSTDTASTTSTTSTTSSRATSAYSPDSETTSVPESPSSGFPTRPSGPSEFSSFLDRYYFHQTVASSNGSSDGYGTPLPSDYASTPRRTSAASTGSCAQSTFNYSPQSSGSSTPNRDEVTTPIENFSQFLGSMSRPAIAST